MNPKYKHDCCHCKFLGHYDNEDLYYCDQSGHPTVIARYGDEGFEYSSGLFFKEITGLNKAKQLAFQKGLLNFKQLN